MHEDSEELGQSNHEENIFVLFYEFQKMIYDQKKMFPRKNQFNFTSTVFLEEANIVNLTAPIYQIISSLMTFREKIRLILTDHYLIQQILYQ